jgi:hypothetical protein
MRREEGQFWVSGDANNSEKEDMVASKNMMASIASSVINRTFFGGGTATHFIFSPMNQHIYCIFSICPEPAQDHRQHQETRALQQLENIFTRIISLLT